MHFNVNAIKTVWIIDKSSQKFFYHCSYDINIISTLIFSFLFYFSLNSFEIFFIDFVFFRFAFFFLGNINLIWLKLIVC